MRQGRDDDNIVFFFFFFPDNGVCQTTIYAIRFFKKGVFYGKKNPLSLMNIKEIGILDKMESVLHLLGFDVYKQNMPVHM